jgi:CheY-like chemotaxis protein
MNAVKSPVRTSQMTVLVVDDDEMVRNIIVEHLKGMGFVKFLTATNGAEAHKFVLDPLQQLDLIICDWEMPKTDGITFLRAVRSNRHRSTIPFIMVTSQQSQERLKITKAKQHEVTAYIVKPFRAETLRAKVFEILLEVFDKEKKGA